MYLYPISSKKSWPFYAPKIIKIWSITKLRSVSCVFLRHMFC